MRGCEGRRGIERGNIRGIGLGKVKEEGGHAFETNT